MKFKCIFILCILVLCFSLPSSYAVEEPQLYTDELDEWDAEAERGYDDGYDEAIEYSDAYSDGCSDGRMASSYDYGYNFDEHYTSSRLSVPCEDAWSVAYADAFYDGYIEGAAEAYQEGYDDGYYKRHDHYSHSDSEQDFSSYDYSYFLHRTYSLDSLKFYYDEITSIRAISSDTERIYVLNALSEALSKLIESRSYRLTKKNEVYDEYYDLNFERINNLSESQEYKNALRALYVYLETSAIKDAFSGDALNYATQKFSLIRSCNEDLFFVRIISFIKLQWLNRDFTLSLLLAILSVFSISFILYLFSPECELKLTIKFLIFLLDIAIISIGFFYCYSYHLKITSMFDNNISHEESTEASTYVDNTLSENPSVDYEPKYVYIGESGTKYHAEDCRTLTGKKYVITLDEALAQGRTSCKICKCGY